MTRMLTAQPLYYEYFDQPLYMSECGFRSGGTSIPENQIALVLTAYDMENI